MPNCRYHIHVICADNDQLLVLNSLAIFFQARAFLTYDVSSQLPKASLYGRQCIDSCDYALMIIGNSYGTVQKTGVSQMHLSYLNAKAKLKPLVVLIKNHRQDADANHNHQLREFTKSVIRQDSQIYYYDTEEDIEQILVQAYYGILNDTKVTGGWIRASEEMIKFSQQTVAERFANLLSNSRTIEKRIDAAIGVVADSVKSTIILSETFDIQYSAQAYEGGNLTDVIRIMTFTWQEILTVLMRIPTPFSSYGLQNTINRLIAVKAEQDIKQDMPNVHAVSRCQIFQDDLNKLQRQLVAAKWIQLTTYGAYGTRVSQELWKLTQYAKTLLDSEDVKPQ